MIIRIKLTGQSPTHETFSVHKAFWMSFLIPNYVVKSRLWSKPAILV